MAASGDDVGGGPGSDADPDHVAEGGGEPVGSEDGRHQRRARNREAVVDALLDLYEEGNLAPSADEITARAGLSPRSLYRYFDDVDDLAGTAIAQAHRRVTPLMVVEATPEEPFDLRVRALVEQRSRLFEAVESVALVTRLRAPFSLVVADNLAVARARLRRQLQNLFVAELKAMPEDVAARRLAAADVAMSFESYRLLRDDQRLTRRRASEALVEALTLLLTPGGPP
jgi:AcrR family transcriptional regulator